jgi:hypothetical protein
VAAPCFETATLAAHLQNAGNDALIVEFVTISTPNF